MKKSLILMLFLLITLTWYHNIQKKITDEDIHYIKIYLHDVDENAVASILSYEEQVELIKIVQSNVLMISPVGKGIPLYQERRPKDLYEFGQGLCFDRSFVLELIFQYLGFETRHVSLFKDSPKIGRVSELTTRGTSSHAISEIKTKKGWIIVDSNYKWIGIDNNNNPVSMNEINESTSNIYWESNPPSYFYTGKHHFIYGLYSRHGKFYKPYNFIPDYNFQELFYNLN